MSGASECFDNRDAVYLGTSHLWDTFVTLDLNLMQQFRWCCDDNWPRYCHCRSSCHGKTGGAPPNVDWNHRCSVRKEMERAHVDAFDSLLEMHSMRPKYIYILKWVLVLVLQLELSCPRPLPNDSMFLTMSFVGSPRSSIQRILQGRDRFVLISFGAIWYNWC